MPITQNTLDAVARVRERLRQMEDAQTLALTAAWVDAWDSLEPEFTAAMTELTAAAQDGRVTWAQANQSARLRAALEQARAVLDGLSDQVELLAVTDATAALLDAADDFAVVVQSQLPPPGTSGVTVSLNRPNPEALAAIIERTTERIHSTRLPLAPDVERAMKRELIRGVAVGDGARDVARRIVRRAEGAFNGGLTRAMNISRTELQDAYREASQLSDEANAAVLAGWQWMAMLDARTCPSCLAQHGQLHPVHEPGPLDHQCGRCARVDKTKGWRDLGFDIDEPEDLMPDARAWFDSLTPENQRAILGPTRLELLNSGAVTWEDLTTRRTSDGWRDSMAPTPVKDLLAKAAG